MRVCGHCGFTLGEGRGNRVFCDRICKMRAYRRRQQGLSEKAYPRSHRHGSALRGPVPMSKVTRKEIAELERLFGG